MHPKVFTGELEFAFKHLREKVLREIGKTELASI